MRLIKPRLVAFLAAAAILAAVSAPEILACHGHMSWRFLPNAQAAVALAKMVADRKAKALLAPAITSPELEKWIKYYDNPIFKVGPPGSWEEFAVDCFTIGYYENKYWMWYVGTPVGARCQIGLAWSDDGVNWTRCPDNPVLRLGAPGTWDEAILLCQHILWEPAEKIFKMWYVGGNPAGVFGIGYATSPDGVHWTKYAGNPVLVATQAWEGQLIEGHSVVKTADGFKMWYGGLDLKSDVSYVGLATSNDGIHWLKHPGNPILSPALDSAAWDGYSVDTPDMHFIDGIYHMYYRGWRKRGGTSWIGHATSTDGIHWERDPENPVLLTATLPNTWDNYQLYRSRLIPGENKVLSGGGVTSTLDRMYFTGRTNTGKAEVGLAFRPPLTTVSSQPPVKPRPRIPMGNQDNMAMSIETTAGGKTSILYFTPWLSQVRMTIYDQTGRKVRALLNEVKLPGSYETVWDGRDAAGRRVPDGLYFGELSSDKYLLTKEIRIAGRR